MSSDTDIFLDRRRLKRHAALWRAGAILGVIVIAAVSLGRDNLSGHRQYVASLGIDGLIVSDTQREQILSDLIDDQDVLAVHDMSPGWQRDLLLEWAPQLVPHVSDHESGLAEALCPDTPESMRDLFGRVGDAIQVRCNIPESVKMFVSLSLMQDSVE